MNKALELLKSLHINKNDYIIVGCSSGPDSMCLLNLLYDNKYNVICAHVNHNIRKESVDEYNYLENFCNERNIIFEGLELNKREKGNEYYYRKKRYEFYKKLADKYQTKYITTAHHADDLMETVLMRISRGSNLKGYIGFSKVFDEKGYILIKPLIYYTKEEILKYLNENKIRYYTDATNDSDDYTRNRYRHGIIPFLKNEHPNVHTKYQQFSEELDKANKYINSVVDSKIKENYKNGIIDLDKFLLLDSYIKECELEHIFSMIYGDDIDTLSKKIIIKIIKDLDTGKNFIMSLPKGYELRREYRKLIIDKPTNKSEYIIPLKRHNVIEDMYIIDSIDECDDTSNYCIRLNREEITLPLYIRSRKGGDRIAVKNMNGTQKVKKIFIDAKVEKRARDTYPIVVDAANNILWIPGIKKSKFDNDITQKYDIILKYTR